MTTRPLDYVSPEPVVRKTDWTTVIGKLGPFIGLIFVYALFATLVNVVPRSQRFATPDNLEIMLRQTAVVGTAALGMTLIIVSGGIDLSVGSNIALSTVVIASVMLRFGGQAPTLAAAAGIATAMLLALLIGVAVAALRVGPFIITLGTWGAYRGIAEGLADKQRVYPAPIENPDAWRDTWLYGLISTLPESRRWMVLPPGVWIMLFLAVVVACVMRYTRFGRHLIAIGSNEQTARLCGVPIARTKMLVYLAAGALFGVAAVLEFSYIEAGDPTTRLGAELDIIAAVVIGGASLAGGQGSIIGSLVGALIMTMVASGCTKLGMENWVQRIATGGIIIFAVALDRLRQRRMG